MTKISVDLERRYDIIFESGCLSKIGEHIKALGSASKIAIITDKNVEDLYANSVAISLKNSGFLVSIFAFEAGEASKTPQNYLNIIEFLKCQNLTRDDIVVALGGGVVGDIAGFAASTYMRGIRFVQVPTTMLAFIDSSIGGKTGVDFGKCKNLIGTFYQPSVILADTSVLRTLPDAEWKNGLGEGLKYAILNGGRIYEILKSGLDKSNIDEFILLCMQAKVDIVTADEKERGVRKLLNLGHTFGHAIEALSNFAVPHGVAVANGILMMSKASYAHMTMSESDFNGICALANMYNLTYDHGFTYADMRLYIESDKKKSGDNSISIVVANGIGNCKIVKMTLDELENYVAKN
ncbi:MAG: 3-dehydroquinate synthase [Clostridia bacterium]